MGTDASTAATAAQAALDKIGTYSEDAYDSNDALQSVANHALDAVTQIASVATTHAREVAININITTTEDSCKLQEIYVCAFLHDITHTWARFHFCMDGDLYLLC